MEPYIISGVLLAIIIILVINGRRKKVTPIDARPPLDVVEKVMRVEKHIPLNEPMRIQVMISGYKAAKEFMFEMLVPPGTKPTGIKKMLYINGKTWVQDIDLNDMFIRRERKTGNLMVKDGPSKWRVWHPFQDIQKKGRVRQQDWVMRFRLINEGGMPHSD